MSCSVMMIGGDCLRCSTATQTSPALSSGEAEIVAKVKGGSHSLVTQSKARDFGDELRIWPRTDSTASKGIVPESVSGRCAALTRRCCGRSA
eukprot:7077781-Pyramimonas_sp.AAC.2